MQIQLNREDDLIIERDSTLQTGRDISREDGLIIEPATPLQTGRDIDSRESQLTVLFISHQAGQDIQGEDNLIIHPDIPLQTGRDISKGGDLIQDVMVLPLQTGHNIDKGGTLPNVFHLHLPEDGVIDQEAPLLVNSKAQVADDTTSHQVAGCGENHQHLETLRSNKTVSVVVKTIQAWSVPTMCTIGEPHVVSVTYNTPPRATGSVGAGLPTETDNRWVAMYRTIRRKLSQLMRYP